MDILAWARHPGRTAAVALCAVLLLLAGCSAPSLAPSAPTPGPAASPAAPSPTPAATATLPAAALTSATPAAPGTNPPATSPTPVALAAAPTAPQPATTASPPINLTPGADGTVHYTIQPGDTLSGIAAEYGASADAIVQVNGITDPNLIKIGEVLRIPLSTPGAYAVATAFAQAPPASATPASAAPATRPPASAGTARPAASPTPAPLEPTSTPAGPTWTPAPPTPTPVIVRHSDGTVTVNGVVYDAYIQAAQKQHQNYHFTCEFDAAWVVLKTYGFDVPLDEMISIVGVDTSTEPTWAETSKGVFIYGGDIKHAYSGDYATNFLARTTGNAMIPLFTHYGLKVTPVHTKAAIEQAVKAGSLVWMKATADFKPGRPATWVLPDGSTWQTVLGNDHAVVVMGYNSQGAVIRDVLGPTSTNDQREYEYLVPWTQFLQIFASQSNDGLAVAPP